jgi:hypothetical protein
MMHLLSISTGLLLLSLLQQFFQFAIFVHRRDDIAPPNEFSIYVQLWYSWPFPTEYWDFPKRQQVEYANQKNVTSIRHTAVTSVQRIGRRFHGTIKKYSRYVQTLF